MVDGPRLKTVEESIEGLATSLEAKDARIAELTVGFEASENRFKEPRINEAEYRAISEHRYEENKQLLAHLVHEQSNGSRLTPVATETSDEIQANSSQGTQTMDRSAALAEERREALKKQADRFRLKYSYGSSLDQKTFVWPGGTHSWEDKSSGIIWVGVHDLNSICVVTRTGDLDLTRVHRDLKYLTIETVLRKFRKTLISEIEDLASPSSKLRESLGQSTLKPFGVVSVIHSSDNDHKESGHEAASSEEDEAVESSQIPDDEYESNEKKTDRLRKAILKRRRLKRKTWRKVAGYDEKKAIKFLREQMRRDTSFANQVSSTEYYETNAINFLLEKMKMGMEAFTVDETIKTAISAFQHLFKKKFKANEIGVTVMDPSYFVSIDEADCKDIYVKELEMSDIEDHLGAINEPGGSVGSLCVGSRSGGFWNGGASMTQVSASASLTSIMALCEESFVLMAVDSRSSYIGLQGELVHEDEREKLFNVGRAVVAAGSGQCQHIDDVKDRISTAVVQQRIADAETLEEVATIFANVVNLEISSRGLNFSLPENFLGFMVAGFVQNTRGIYIIERNPNIRRFVARPSWSRRVSCLGTGSEPMARYQWSHPLPGRWSVDEAIDYCVDCMEDTFVADPRSGGNINVRAIYGWDSPGEKFAFEEEVYDGQSGYYPVP